jgi:hypothetical protein
MDIGPQDSTIAAASPSNEISTASTGMKEATKQELGRGLSSDKIQPHHAWNSFDWDLSRHILAPFGHRVLA